LLNSIEISSDDSGRLGLVLVRGGTYLQQNKQKHVRKVIPFH
jgi:hypothetical protein